MEDRTDSAPRQAETGRSADKGAGLLIGRPFGVPVYLSRSWLLVVGAITWVYARQVQDDVPRPWQLAVGLGFAVLLYASVLVHELAHTWVALRGGLPVRRISLHVLGGVSEIERPSTSPRQEAWIAGSGPLVSLLLGALAYAVGRAFEPGGVARALADALTFSNVLVGVFNLLPGLPLDGGRVLSAAVWQVTGRRHAGAVAAAWVGRGVAVVTFFLPALLGAARGRQPDLVDLVLGTVLAAFIWLSATQALQAARVQQRIPGLSARALTRRAIPVAVDVPVAEALRRAEEAGASRLVVVGGDGAPLALVEQAAALATPEARRPWVPVGDVARRLEPDLVVSADLGGDDLVSALTRRPASEYLVVEANGEVYGVLATADVERALLPA